MKKLTLLFLICAAALSFGQSPNVVEITARHCAKYQHAQRYGFLHLQKKLVVDQAACNADPSTVYYSNTQHNLRTYAGLDFSATQLAGAASATNVAVFIAVSTDATAPAQTDTTVAGEVTTNGLQRASATYSHASCNASACNFTLTKVFTASGTVSNIQKAGVFTLSAGGTLVYENTFPVVTVNSPDTLTVTWTVQLSGLHWFYLFPQKDAPQVGKVIEFPRKSVLARAA